jgi:hypothetical protein
MLFPDLPWLAGIFMTANRIQTATHPKESSNVFNLRLTWI